MSYIGLLGILRIDVVLGVLEISDPLMVGAWASTTLDLVGVPEDSRASLKLQALITWIFENISTD
jgi:hypothetical protein